MMRAAKLLALIATLTLGAFPQKSIVPAAPGRKLALLIGNAAYPGMALKNPANDARAIAATLNELGFQVDLALDVNRPTLEASIDRFIAKLHPADVALFYYSGHGVQVDGENYLLPVDFAAREEADVKYQAYSAARLHDRMQGTGARLNILILDACRDNPFRGSRSGTKGWATMGTGSGKGSLVAFATAPGATASDNAKEANGLFTKYLLDALRRPGLDLDNVFKQVREQVYEASKEKQLPWTVSSVIGTFVFRDPEEEDRKRRAELARLEAELKEVEKRQADANRRKSEQEAADKAREAEALRARIEFEKQEAVRLKKESEDRQAALWVDRTNGDQERLAELKRKLSTASVSPVGNLTWQEAKAEADSLSRKIQEVRKEIGSEMAKATVQLAAAYAASGEKLKQPLQRDPFETTAEYEGRLRTQKAAQDVLEQKYSKERAGLEQRYEILATEQAQPYAAKLKDLNARTYRLDGVKVELGAYDADKGVYNMTIDGKHHSLKIAPTRARELFLARDGAVAERSLDGLSVFVIEPIGGMKWLAGRSGMNPVDWLIYVWIRPGSFQMGCSPGDKECYEDEKPAKQVAILKGFWIGESEVTQAAYRKVTGNTPSNFKGDELPVEEVNRDDARSYCRAIGGRLPTEAEWEYAARAGTTGARYGELDRIAWYGSNSGNKTHPVKQKEANAWGLYDMLGNVWEWVEGEQSLRGGSWDNVPRYTRVSDRYNYAPSFRYVNLGFRCVWE